MKAFFERLIREATAPIKRGIARFVQSAVLLSIAGICLIIMWGFLTAALFIFLEDRYGGTIAALAVAGVYLFFAIVCVVVLKIMQRSAAKPEELQPTFAAATSDVVAEEVQRAAEPWMEILETAGLYRERAALLMSGEALHKMKPMQLVGMAVLGGFVFGRVITGGRRRGDKSN
ncbi:MAG: phage holin family protein [Methylobacteriaceae bacterium]|nr:phage holin family protein [Methylobacteriaceae bacterium]